MGSLLLPDGSTRPCSAAGASAITLVVPIATKTSTLSSREKQLPDSSSVVLSFVSYPCATHDHSVILDSRVYGKRQRENELKRGLYAGRSPAFS